MKEVVMPSNVKAMLADANAVVPRVSPTETRELIDRGNVLVVDVRDPLEVQTSGKIKGALNISRGMLEFRADPESPYYNAELQKEKIVLVYCASGGRSALAGKTLKDFGYDTVFNIGGFKELAEGGLETEPADS